MKINMKKLATSALLLGSMATLVGCGGSSGGSSSWGAYSSPYVTADQFVNALNRIDPQLAASDVILYEDETIRSADFFEDDWFVIYDAKYDENKAFNLDWLRTVVYYDYYSNSTGLAEEFRDREGDDIFAGDVNGDFWGDKYEVVDPVYNFFGDFLYFRGRNSGWEYNEGDETTDASLMVKEKTRDEILKKGAAISYEFSMPIEEAISVASLGKKLEKMVSKGRSLEELTPEDQSAITKDLEHLTGVSVEEVMAAALSDDLKIEVNKKIAKKLKVSSQTLEGRILPELLGIK
ncbi:MAG: hypothetical protein GY909_05500 [Oligoflexia bacterium]|nr:hypothetical protein [Oligoflexia bacterium]